MTDSTWITNFFPHPGKTTITETDWKQGEFADEINNLVKFNHICQRPQAQYMWYGDKVSTAGEKIIDEKTMYKLYAMLDVDYGIDAGGYRRYNILFGLAGQTDGHQVLFSKLLPKNILVTIDDPWFGLSGLFIYRSNLVVSLSTPQGTTIYLFRIRLNERQVFEVVEVNNSRIELPNAVDCTLFERVDDVASLLGRARHVRPTNLLFAVLTKGYSNNQELPLQLRWGEIPYTYNKTTGLYTPPRNLTTPATYPGTRPSYYPPYSKFVLSANVNKPDDGRAIIGIERRHEIKPKTV